MNASTTLVSNNYDYHKELMLQPYKHLLKCRSKKFAWSILTVFNHWLGIPQEKFELIEEIVEMILNTGILLDDIYDNSTTRRGQPTAHLIYGTPKTINCSINTILLALKKVVEMKNIEAVNIFCKQSLELALGAQKDLYYSEHLLDLTEDEYLQMCKDKARGIIKMAVELGQLFSKNTKDFSKLIDLLALYFQICNDYLNYTSKNAESCFYEDLSMGKLSLPVLYAIKNCADNNQIFKILKQKTKNLEVLQYCVSLIEKQGGFNYTRRKIEEIKEEIRREVEKLGDNPHLMELLEKMYCAKL